MHKIKILVLVALCVTLFSGNAVAEVIYHELFAGDGTSSIAHVSWNYYVQWLPYQIYSETGTDEWGNVLYGTWAIGNVGTSGGVDAGIGSVNSNPVVPDADDNGVYYSGGGYMNSLTYTAEYEINMSDWKDFVISFNHFNSEGGTPYRAALAIASSPTGNPTWYLSDPNVAVATTGWDEPRVVIDTSASTGWYELDMDFIDIGSATTLPASGYIRGFGIHHVGQAENSQLYDNFMVEATYKGTTNTLTVKVEPNDVGINTVVPAPGDYEYSPGGTGYLYAGNDIICPDTWVFDHWEGDVADANAASTTVTVDTAKTVTAVYVATQNCGDTCHPYPVMDFDLNCIVDANDLKGFVSEWMDCTHPDCD